MTTRPHLDFDRERAAYAAAKPGLLASAPGRYVVFVGDEMAGPFDSHDEAEAAGYARWGIGPLFIKQVVEVEPVVYFNIRRSEPMEPRP